jgi:succinate dehydrogenase/fumarate reductase flavoprotein subunit
MTSNARSNPYGRVPLEQRDGTVVAQADVLVLGGGLSGCAAALAAAEGGASVVIAEKGYCGTSGAAASAGVGVWYVPPDPELREEAMASREKLGGYLADRGWMERVLDETYAQVNRIADWGYPFPDDGNGGQARNTLQGPEIMRRLRRQVVRARVRILDHSPALELLQRDDEAVGGATGVRRRHGDRWRVHAPAVVMATGGCGFQSGGLGCDVLTGDGHLLAAELGAQLSGMEFSNSYAISPVFSSVTKTAIYHHATFTYADNTPIPGAGSQRGRSVIARTLLTQPVFCILDGWPEEDHVALRRSQPNFFLSFDRVGIDPFRERFPVTLRLEGTIRGTGGLRVIGPDCATTVPGLFASGDVATRELICGGFTGGGSHNAAWALSSGRWAGLAAAAHARGVRPSGTANSAAGGHVRATGGAGLRPTGTTDPDLCWEDVVCAVQGEVHPYDRNYLRNAQTLNSSRTRLDDLWGRVRAGLRSESDPVRAREAAAMCAHARWMYVAALQRTETRGMHKRSDHPELDPEQQRRLVVGGLDHLWIVQDGKAHWSASVAAA